MEKPMSWNLYNFKVIYSLCNSKEMLTFFFPLFQESNKATTSSWISDSSHVHTWNIIGIKMHEEKAITIAK